MVIILWFFMYESIRGRGRDKRYAGIRTIQVDVHKCLKCGKRYCLTLTICGWVTVRVNLPLIHVMLGDVTVPEVDALTESISAFLL